MLPPGSEMDVQPCPNYVLLADMPPMKEGGQSCNVLAWNWILAMGPQVKLVVTHRETARVDLRIVADDLPVPSVFYPDLSRTRVLWKKRVLEVCLAFVFAGRVVRAARRSGANRIFAFFAANPWFLVVSRLIAWRTKLPLDVYLVDDLEESCRLIGKPFLARFVRWLEPRMLKGADRVFVISPGFVEHMKKKYDVDAEWLPIPFPTQRLVYQPFSPPEQGVRTIAYIGAVNPLYLSALIDLLKVVQEWNSRGKSFKIKVLLLSYLEQETLEKLLGHLSHWELRFRLSTKDCRKILRDSWVIFLPYSFEESVRTMVSTSFPSRLAECLTAGRPLLVYGPPYASLPRYFVENGLALCVQSQGELEASLTQIDQSDSPALIEKYQEVLMRYHSKEAIRSHFHE
jgi:hypothetical protein